MPQRRLQLRAHLRNQISHIQGSWRPQLGGHIGFPTKQIMLDAIAQCAPQHAVRLSPAVISAAAGFPAARRLASWMQASGAATIRTRSPQTYRYWTEQEVSARDAQQIEKDAPRANFDLGALREAALRRILRAHACRRRDLGYTQGLNIVVATMLLAERQHSPADEETCFWLLCAVVDRLTPDYYNASLSGVRTDFLVLEGLLREHPTLSDMPALLDERGVDISILATPWLMVAFANALPPVQLLRAWDLFFVAGSRALLAMGLAIFQLQAPALRQTSSFDEAYPLMTELRPARYPGLPEPNSTSTRGKGLYDGSFWCDRAEEVLPTEPFLSAALEELQRLPPERLEALRVEARRVQKKDEGPKGRLELKAFDERRQKLLETARGHAATAAVLASVGFDPHGCPHRWASSEACFVRSTLRLSTATRVGELHLLSDDATAVPIIGTYLRGLKLSAIDGLDDGTRRRLHRVRFRLKATARPVVMTRDAAVTSQSPPRSLTKLSPLSPSGRLEPGPALWAAMRLQAQEAEEARLKAAQHVSDKQAAIIAAMLADAEATGQDSDSDPEKD